MKISAQVRNGGGEHHITLLTNDRASGLSIAPKPGGGGSSVNGGELLFLALATCYCNDVYREAAKRGISVRNLEVFVEGEFTAEGAAARNVSYRAKVTAEGSEAEIKALLEHTDRVAEVQNTLRSGIPVALSSVEVVLG
ncbi:MAG TPA: OsmC family protein [Candidatus Paceibacterota bacterium]|nr:OsmC family protein [Candidatus Paceibacterota bacterium]